MTEDMDARARVKRMQEEVEALRHDIERHIRIASEAEAECERLRVRERQLYDALWTLNGHAMLYMGSLADNVSEEVGAALATPPPEGEPSVEAAGREAYPQAYESDAPHTPEQGGTQPELLTGRGDQRPKRGGWAPGFYANTCQTCGRSFVGDKWAWTCADCAYAPHTPQQAHGDALAALVADYEDAMLEWSPDVQQTKRPILDAARQALNDSGVPEEVRRLPEDWERGAAELRELNDHDSADLVRGLKDELEAALASAPAVTEWVQPAWHPIDTYPKDDGKYRNGTRCWLWHETLGVVWGFMDDLPSGFRCELSQNSRGVWEVVAAGVKAARKIHYWMPPAPAMPESPIAAAPTDGRE